MGEIIKKNTHQLKNFLKEKKLINGEINLFTIKQISLRKPKTC